MREIVTRFDATLLEGVDPITALQGIIIESRGGNPERNPQHADLLRFVLERLRSNRLDGIRFYVAARPRVGGPIYNSTNDRLLHIDGDNEFSFASIDPLTFYRELTNAIIASGKAEGSTGGAPAKRILITSNDERLDWASIFS